MVEVVVVGTPIHPAVVPQLTGQIELSNSLHGLAPVRILPQPLSSSHPGAAVALVVVKVVVVGVVVVVVVVATQELHVPGHNF